MRWDVALNIWFIEQHGGFSLFRFTLVTKLNNQRMDKYDPVILTAVIFFCTLALYSRATDIWNTLKEILEELRKRK
jgi:hypothetical protein